MPWQAAEREEEATVMPCVMQASLAQGPPLRGYFEKRRTL